MIENYVKLGDLATYINGYAFKPQDRGDAGLPIIRIQDLTGNSYDKGFYDGEYPSKIEINNGDVLISWSASLGVYLWNGGKALLNQHIFKVDFDKKEIDKNYFIYAVRFSLKKLRQLTHGATMKHIVKRDFENVSIPYPLIKEQKKIAKILKELEEIIEIKQKELSKLDTLIKARFVEMFGDIKNNQKYNYKQISSFTNVVSGGTPKRDVKEYWDNGTIPWVKTTELKNKKVNSTEEYITKSGLQNSSAKLVPAHTILIAMYGQGKTRGMTAYLEKEAATNQACACILPSSNINSEYLWQYLIMSYNELRNMAKGGNQPNLNSRIIKNFPVLYPPVSLQNKFASFVQQVDKSKVVIQKSLDETQTLFDSLMQKYFS